jgi:hypothetical protein
MLAENFRKCKRFYINHFTNYSHILLLRITFDGNKIECKPFLVMIVYESESMIWKKGKSG